MIGGPSPIAQAGIRATSPLAVMVAAFLFFAGHNQPGGGFAAGLVLGAMIALRAIAGMSRPRDAVRLLAAGGLVAAAVAAAPMLWGASLLNQATVEQELPLLGLVKTGTALVFDAGVTLVVVGLVIALVNGLIADELGTAPEEVSES